MGNHYGFGGRNFHKSSHIHALYSSIRQNNLISVHLNHSGAIQAEISGSQIDSRKLRQILELKIFYIYILPYFKKNSIDCIVFLGSKYGI